jgi:hypothetical protein
MAFAWKRENATGRDRHHLILTLQVAFSIILFASRVLLELLPQSKNNAVRNAAEKKMLEPPPRE